MLCGDSNQIVHPNFFSWSAVKSLFFTEQVAAESAEEQITYLENELTQKEWEQHEIHKRWISVILEMSEILSDWDNVNSQTSLVS